MPVKVKKYNTKIGRICSVRMQGIVSYTSIILIGSFFSLSAYADVSFTDIAENDGAGVTYRSHETASDRILDLLKAKPIFNIVDGDFMPGKSRGNPGVAIFDYDKDGDLDIYVSDSSLAHSGILYENQFVEQGSLTVSFEDVTDEAGLNVPGFAGTGVCFADTDNDGDQDLYVLGIPYSRFFENNGDGSFTDESKKSHLNIGDQYPSSCSFGDIDGDGLLDLAIANSYDRWDNRFALRLFEFSDLMIPNQLMLNTGDNVFTDVSKTSGIQNVSIISWAVALVDYDLDGDLDLFSADDQGPKPPESFGGMDIGYVRIYENDGHGNFTDVTDERGGNQFGAWMGLSFGDYNSDGNMDFFATNAGDYLIALMGPMVGGGKWSSTWFLGSGDGSFEMSDLGDLRTTPFGWGASSNDYDNDGDLDIVFAGGLDMGAFIASNPGAILNNQGDASFNRDGTALPSSDYHLRRNVQGIAIGDLNNDGFMDIIDVSNQNWPDFMPLADYPALGGQFDGIAKFWPTFTPINPLDPFEGFVWNRVEPNDGTLSVKINSGNTNHWLKVNTVGSVDLTRRGQVNRDGIGAVVTVTPANGKPVMSPVLSGASHTSAHALELGFGLGSSEQGTVDILWPGGVKNKLFNVKAGESITFPEIPCSYTDISMGKHRYKHCVKRSLRDLNHAGIISWQQKHRFFKSALMAYGMD